MVYNSMNLIELTREKELLEKQYADFKKKNLFLDMSRGKPSQKQVALSNKMLKAIGSDFVDQSGADVRNYGNLSGIEELRRIFGGMLGLPADNVVVGGNASLNLMFDTLSRAMLFGLADSPEPWCRLPKVKFLCPCPGYDRHFAMLEKLGIEMLPVPMTESGPDMDLVCRLAESDPAVKGIFCVPAYSNPTGITYSDQTVETLASMKTAAPDFTVMWDNAYCIHHLYDEACNQDRLANIFELCQKHGTQNRALIFCSFSKISFAGGSVSCVAGSDDSLEALKSVMSVQTIGHDKINQLMHTRFFGNLDGVEAHMKKHAELLRPKFKAVLDTLEASLAPCGFARWNNPRGGYFILLRVMEGTAATVVRLCAEAGVKLTAAGAPFPYGKDPLDDTLRLAPSYPEVGELKKAAQLLCISARLAAVCKLLEGLMQPDTSVTVD